MSQAAGTGVRRIVPRERVLICLVALVVCVAVPVGLVPDDYLRTVLWGGAILVSAVGWGAVVARRLYGDGAHLGWGLEAALGLAVHLALGGLLAALSLVSVTTSWITVALGVALFTLEARRGTAAAAPASPDRARGGDSRIAIGLVALLVGVALIHYLAWATERPANIIDDFQAYLSFPKQLLGSGTLIEPFSSRRIDSYGGQSYLQALVLAFSTVSRIGLLDYGICVLVLAGLVVGWVRERPRLPIAVATPALLALVTLHYYDLNHNAASEFSGAVFFLAIFRILDRPRRDTQSAWPTAVTLALVAAAACTLRQSNLAAASLIPAAYYGLRLARERATRRHWAKEAALTAALTLTLLLPWMILAYRSCGTPLYPVIIGNGAHDFMDFEPISTVDKARYVLAAGLYPGRLPGLLLAFTAGLALPARASLALRASLAGTALATLMLLDVLASADAVDGTDRYLFPYGLAYLLAVALVAARAVTQLKTPAIPAIKPARSAIAMTLVAGALALQLFQGRHTLAPLYRADVDAIKTALTNPPLADPGDALYADLQHAVPEHTTLLVMLDQPFRLDYRRNRILLWDQPGAASPPPHLPIGQGPDALNRYLLGQGIRYVAYCDGPAAEFMDDPAVVRLSQGIRYAAYCDGGPPAEYKNTLKHFLREPAPARDGNSDGPALRNIARLYMDIVGNLEKLTATRTQLYTDKNIHVLDLATPTPTPTRNAR